MDVMWKVFVDDTWILLGIGDILLLINAPGTTSFPATQYTNKSMYIFFPD